MIVCSDWTNKTKVLAYTYVCTKRVRYMFNKKVSPTNIYFSLRHTAYAPIERQRRMTFDPGVAAIASKVGAKNMHSSSGCAVTSRIVFPLIAEMKSLDFGIRHIKTTANRQTTLVQTNNHIYIRKQQKLVMIIKLLVVSVKLQDRKFFVLSFS